MKLSLAVMSFTGLQSFKTWRAVAFQKCVTRQTCLLDWISKPTANSLQQVLNLETKKNKHHMMEVKV